MSTNTKFYQTLRYSPTKNFASSTTPQWNTQLRLLANESLFENALSVYLQMLRSGSSPNAFTFPFALKSCASLSVPFTGRQLHCHVLKTGCLLEPFVQTSLISMYSKCGFIDYARKVFDENPHSNNLTVCYNSLISGYALDRKVKDAVLLFNEMRELSVVINGVTMLGLVPSCGDPGNLNIGMSVHGFCVKFGFDNEVSVGNCLLTMYAKCGEVTLARKLFDGMPRKGLITWNAMITGYAQNGLATDVLQLYREMESSRIAPDPITFAGVLSSCAHLGARSVSGEIEERMNVCGFASNPFLNNALINVYARCGNLVRARDIFDSMPTKSIVSWTAVVGGYGMHGQGDIAVELFEDMTKTGIIPDGTAFVSVLSACSHAGLIDKGMEYFGMMQSKYGLQPGLEHYSCMVDLLGRAGRLHEARELIGSMKVKPDGAVWGALLGACKIHKNLQLAELAFERVIELEPTNIGYYVLMYNIYNEARNAEGMLKVRVMMREKKLKKEPGYSYMEFKGRIHLFFAGDRIHSQTEDLYKVLEELENLVKELDEFDENDQERDDEFLNSMGVHSEKLAIAFGLLNITEESDIVVIKNLRICGDCHSFIKLVSKIVNHQFVVRDATRFHHFRNGLCSCKDYW